MKINNAEDILGLLNRLPALLRWAGMKNFGSNLHLTYVAPGAQYVHHIDTQIFGERRVQKPKESMPVKNTLPTLPPKLANEAAMALWRKLQESGYMDEHFQPTVSRPEAAVMAFEIAKRLEIEDKWKAFETLWNRRNMYRDYHTAINQKKSLKFRDDLKATLG